MPLIKWYQYGTQRTFVLIFEVSLIWQEHEDM